MRFFSVILLLAAAAVLCSAAPLLLAKTDTAIDGSYIVVLKNRLGTLSHESHVMNLQKAISELKDESKIVHKYKMGSFTGFSARLSKKLLQAQLNHPDVLYIEADQKMTASFETQKNAVWGLARISSQSTNSTTYQYNKTAGSGVDVFVIDTGINTAHVDFEGRAESVFNAIVSESGEDLNGHGTHCSGTIGGATYGVAKQVSLKGVKVLDRYGSGTNAGVIAGVNYVTNHRNHSRATVASMSLGGGVSSALDAAITASIESGIVYAIAAGNEEEDACNSSPARIKTAVTVGAIDNIDHRAYFSNYGKCVNIFAPGVNIKSDWIGSTTATNTISGTSMATPHVAGVLALHLSSFPTLTPAQSAAWLYNVAANDVVVDRKGSANKLLHSPAV